MTKQLAHHQYQKDEQHLKIILLCDHLQSPANIGAIFRLADAFAVQEVLFTQSVNSSSSRLKRTARETYKSVPYRIIEDRCREIVGFHESGYTSIALELTQTSIPLQQLTKNEADKYVLIIGNEKTGVSDELLAKAQQQGHIPMYGQNSSMNVAQATAIGLYHLSYM